MYEGKEFEFGSIIEQIAMTTYARQKNADFIKAVLVVIDPKSASKAVNQLRSMMFPEEKYDELSYMKKAQEMFEKLRKVNLRINPF